MPALAPAGCARTSVVAMGHQASRRSLTALVAIAAASTHMPMPASAKFTPSCTASRRAIEGLPATITDATSKAIRGSWADATALLVPLEPAALSKAFDACDIAVDSPDKVRSLTAIEKLRSEVNYLSKSGLVVLDGDDQADLIRYGKIARRAVEGYLSALEGEGGGS